VPPVTTIRIGELYANRRRHFKGTVG
jgi:hypothetical protein